MVMAAARRVLRHEEDAEDAFQAPFLALAAACERLRRKTALDAWLHQTALRTARSIGRTNAK
jgi:DNA-directed RNA polymerase specialized sigma24 family protein